MVTPRRIGLDLDNTVIDYAPAYRAVAREMGLPQQLVDRESIRESLRKSEEDDEEWQRFQSMQEQKRVERRERRADVAQQQHAQSHGEGDVRAVHVPERFGETKAVVRSGLSNTKELV